MAEQEAETLLDLDDLDSLTLDDVDEAPEFMAPPSGKYKLGITHRTSNTENAKNIFDDAHSDL